MSAPTKIRNKSPCTLPTTRTATGSSARYLSGIATKSRSTKRQALEQSDEPELAERVHQRSVSQVGRKTMSPQHDE